jgi:tetratricopeptide (TPR) repeat protein
MPDKQPKSDNLASEVAQYEEWMKNMKEACTQWKLENKLREHNQEAIDDFNKSMLEKYPCPGDRANAKFKLEKYEESLPDYYEYLETNPENTDALWKIAAAKFNTGKYEEAIKGFGEILKKPHSCPQGDTGILSTMGKAMMYLERHEEAVEYFDEALKQPHSSPEEFAYIWENRGNANMKLGRCEESIKDYDEYLKLHDSRAEDAAVFGFRGDAKMQLERYQEALEDFKKYEAISPGYTSILLKIRVANWNLQSDQKIQMKGFGS